MRNYTDTEILDKIKTLEGYNRNPNNILIVGVQSLSKGDDSFNDNFFVYNSKNEFLIATTGTTNCGQSALKNYMKLGLSGAAVWKTEMFYEGLYKFGFHKGKMRALIQQKRIYLYRDNDKDAVFEEQGSLHFDIIGANFHGVSYEPNSTKFVENIGEWSYGCQVVNDMRKYNQIITVAKSYPAVDFALIKEF